MINEIHIFDDIVDIEIQNKIETYVYDKNVVWEEVSNITSTKESHAAYSFPAKVLYNNLDKNILKLIDIIIDTSLSKIDKKLLQKYRAKINKTTPHNIDLNEEFRLLHVDRPIQHVVMIYYINDSDGDTLIFDDKNNKNLKNIKEFFNYNNFLDLKNFELNKSISPKKGRVVIFDGSLWHYGKYPTFGERNVVNINLVINEGVKSII